MMALHGNCNLFLNLLDCWKCAVQRQEIISLLVSNKCQITTTWFLHSITTAVLQQLYLFSFSFFFPFGGRDERIFRYRYCYCYYCCCCCCCCCFCSYLKYWNFSRHHYRLLLLLLLHLYLFSNLFSEVLLRKKKFFLTLRNRK